MKKVKLLSSLLSFCFALAVLCFGVYAAQSVTYTIGGTLTYSAEGVYVDISGAVYRSIDNTLLGDDAIAYASTVKAGTLSTSQGLSTLHLESAGSLTNAHTYQNGQVNELVGNEGTTNLSLTFGAWAQEEVDNEQVSNQKGYAYYIVFEITNFGTNDIVATLTQNSANNSNTTTNTLFSNPLPQETISAASTSAGTLGRLVFALALDDLTKSESGNFSYILTIEEAPDPYAGFVFGNPSVTNNVNYINIIDYKGSSTDITIVSPVVLNGTEYTVNIFEPESHLDSVTSITINTQNFIGLWGLLNCYENLTTVSFIGYCNWEMLNSVNYGQVQTVNIIGQASMIVSLGNQYSDSINNIRGDRISITITGTSGYTFNCGTKRPDTIYLLKTDGTWIDTVVNSTTYTDVACVYMYDDTYNSCGAWISYTMGSETISDEQIGGPVEEFFALTGNMTITNYYEDD